MQSMCQFSKIQSPWAPSAFCVVFLIDLFVAGRDQSATDQPNNLAEGHPIVIIVNSMLPPEIQS
jgi:hypothetical protein